MLYHPESVFLGQRSSWVLTRSSGFYIAFREPGRDVHAGGLVLNMSRSDFFVICILPSTCVRVIPKPHRDSRGVRADATKAHLPFQVRLGHTVKFFA